MSTDGCVSGLKHPRPEVTVHHFRPMYHTEILAIVQCMYADYVILNGGQVGWWMTFSGGGGDPPMGRGKFVLGCGKSHNTM